MALLIPAISLGFLGSFHCIGMCGPIALSLPVGSAKPAKRLLLILIYNAGRIFTYTIFGLLFGLIGQGFLIGGYQQLLSITLGSILLISVVLPPDFALKHKFSSGTFRFFNTIKTSLGNLFLKSGYRPLFLIGLLNGLLPCGLVYMGVAGAIASGDSLKGAAFMAMFGLGTAPAMMTLPFVGNLISLTFRNNIRKAMPIVIGSMAILLILRGLNLGIPYLSPKMETQGIAACHSSLSKENTCHKKVILCTGPGSTHKK